MDRPNCVSPIDPENAVFVAAEDPGLAIAGQITPPGGSIAIGVFTGVKEKFHQTPGCVVDEHQ